MTGWIEPPDRNRSAEYWLTRRNADASEEGALGLPDVRVKYRWASSEKAWIKGMYQGRQRQEANLVCLHSNNGWRIECEDDQSAAIAEEEAEQERADNAWGGVGA